MIDIFNKSYMYYNIGIIVAKIGNRFAIIHMASHVYFHIRSHKILENFIENCKLLKICKLGKKITGNRMPVFSSH